MLIISETLKRFSFIKTVMKNVRNTMDNFKKIQRLWKRAILNSGWRRLFCGMMFSKEVDYLIWIYEKKLRLLKGKPSKTHKYYETIIEKL
jgi:hypothetical protein